MNKQQYSRAKKANAILSQSWPIASAEDVDSQDLIKLIEELRNVARAAQDCVYGKEPLSVDEADMKGQLDALPEWVLEENA